MMLEPKVIVMRKEKDNVVAEIWKGIDSKRSGDLLGTRLVLNATDLPAILPQRILRQTLVKQLVWVIKYKNSTANTGAPCSWDCFSTTTVQEITHVSRVTGLERELLIAFCLFPRLCPFFKQVLV